MTQIEKYSKTIVINNLRDSWEYMLTKTNKQTREITGFYTIKSLRIWKFKIEIK